MTRRVVRAQATYTPGGIPAHAGAPHASFSRGNIDPLSHEQFKRPAVVVDKILEDFRELSSEGLGKVKNLGHGDRNVMPSHVKHPPSFSHSLAQLAAAICCS